MKIFVDSKGLYSLSLSRPGIPFYEVEFERSILATFAAAIFPAPTCALCHFLLSVAPVCAGDYIQQRREPEAEYQEKVVVKWDSFRTEEVERRGRGEKNTA